MNLYDYQEQAVLHALNSREQYTLIASPTGTGKSYMILEEQKRRESAWVITPRIEIIRDMLKKLGYNADLYTEQQIIDASWRMCITTPMRLRNLMLKGEFREPLKHLIWDEVHHHSADSYQLLDLMAGVRSTGYTATPFRGTPKQTAEFRDKWGEPYWAITLHNAVSQGVLAIPEVTIKPLIDDDIVKVVNGEFQIESLDDAIRTRLDDVVELLEGYYDIGHPECTEQIGEVVLRGQGIDKPTMISVPSSKCAYELAEAMGKVSLPARVVNQATSFADRKAAFASCIKGQSFLIQIDVVSEGVDLPQLRRLVDLRPTLSPVKWLQQVGRITRPGPITPEYVCTNRNLLRHCYLLEGMIPIGKVLEAQEAFPKTARTLAMRTLGLEALGRFKPTTVKLSNGLDCVFYSLSSLDNGRKIDYTLILHPMISTPLVAKREMSREQWDAIIQGTLKRGANWREQSTPLTEVTGFQSVTAKSISEKQRAWWERSAERFGLDSSQKIDAKQFQILPVLSDLGKRIL